MPKFFDKSTLSARSVDGNGFVNIERNPLTRCGVFEYTKREIEYPGWEDAPDELVGVLRHPDDVASPETLESLKRKPIIINHTMAVGGEGAKVEGEPLEQIGAQGTTGDLIEFDPETGIVYGPISLWTASGQTAVDKLDIDEFSLGYDAGMEFENGSYLGKPYVARQRNIFYNHVALVPAGRMGSDIRVLDSAPKGKTMKISKWKQLGNSLGLADSAPRAEVLAKVLGTTAAAIATMDAKTLAHFDAEEEVKDEDGEGDMTVKELTAAVKQMKPLMETFQQMIGGEKAEAAGINAGEGMAGATDSPMMKAMDGEEGEEKEMLKDGMEPAMMDGLPMRDSRGRIVYKPKGMTLKDAAAAKKLKAGKGRTQVADAMTAAQIEALAEKKTKAVLDAAAAKSADTDAALNLARQASPVVGTFDAAGKTLHQVAEYVLGKIDSSNTARGAEALGFVRARLADAQRKQGDKSIAWADSASGGFDIDAAIGAK